MSRRSVNEIKDWGVHVIPDDDGPDWGEIILGIIYVIIAVLFGMVTIPANGTFIGIVQAVYWPIYLIYVLFWKA